MHSGKQVSGPEIPAGPANFIFDADFARSAARRRSVRRRTSAAYWRERAVPPADKIAPGLTPGIDASPPLP
ncbi:hypothetical protein D6B98_06525 [Bradyrhizobium sp. LVM 105]|uniref:Uncharacterized protein n=1 Tax=Bradyrhizobium frederickii TaxID=2560054 RepID=A0A4Y9LGL2_9BRAD|nr:hypothetical protein D6B98_06525 [Bradyrhizobium sp. LVM 105]TFV41514.1 hypothetical protein E4K66_04115 [Bradyrhizobium frederickii]